MYARVEDKLFNGLGVGYCPSHWDICKGALYESKGLL